MEALAAESIEEAGKWVNRPLQIYLNDKLVIVLIYMGFHVKKCSCLQIFHEFLLNGVMKDATGSITCTEERSKNKVSF